MNFIQQAEAEDMAAKYLANDQGNYSTQELLDSGAVPRLKGYIVIPGKVSDSIVGGHIRFLDKKSGNYVEHGNPTLEEHDGTPLRIMIRTPRISTHDITRGEIPFKDQVLATNHNFMRKLLMDYIGTSQYDVGAMPDNSVVIVAENLTQIPFENVMRAFMAKSNTSTSLYMHYVNGERSFCGHKLPDNLIANGPLPYVMDTPSTKDDKHDMSVDPQYLFDNNVCTPEEYTQIRNSSLVAFGIVTNFLRTKGMIAVDTKTEHGKNRKGQIVSQDEIWTLDSSRFWLMDDYNTQWGQRLRGEIKELNPTSMSKEFARGFSKKENEYTESEKVQISARYIIGIQKLTGERFEPDMRPREERVVSGLQKIVERMVA